MNDLPENIAAIAVDSTTAVQSLLAELAGEWRRAGAKVVGVIAETHGLPDRTCGAGFLRDIASGKPYSIYLEAAPKDTSCHLDAGGVATASESLLDQIPAGDLVVLNKFGKLEALHRGLAPAFDKAIASGKPLLTTVSDMHRDVWRAYAPGALYLPGERGALESWWRSMQTSHRQFA